MTTLPDRSASDPHLSDVALRALEEASIRGRAREQSAVLPIECGGPSGPEPTRYGDWERKGLAVDF
jgi:hypothetical protein